MSDAAIFPWHNPPENPTEPGWYECRGTEGGVPFHRAWGNGFWWISGRSRTSQEFKWLKVQPGLYTWRGPVGSLDGAAPLGMPVPESQIWGPACGCEASLTLEVCRDELEHLKGEFRQVTDLALKMRGLLDRLHDLLEDDEHISVEILDEVNDVRTEAARWFDTDQN